MYRDNGAIGALLDEYEKALSELVALVSTVSEEELTTIVDRETEDEDCRSIQTILTHVISAGHYYVTATRNSLGEHIARREKEILPTIKAYLESLATIMDANLQLFKDYPDIKMETYDPEEKILTSWGQRYDVDQMMEHAIVHILRHRRQIERFLLKLRTDKIT